MTTTKKKLPADLHDAYAWTEAAGELGELSKLTGDDLTRYCAESAANCVSNGDGSVTEEDLESLHDWLNASEEGTMKTTTTKTQSGTWEWKHCPTAEDDMAIGAALIGPDGDELAACLFSGGEMDVESDGCGVFDGRRTDDIDWPDEDDGRALVFPADDEAR